MDRKFVIAALGYALLGMALGIYMGAVEDFAQYSTHGHLLLLGFGVSFIYAVCHKLWLGNPASRLAVAQFYLHHAGTLLLVSGLFLRTGGYAGMETVGPVMAASSLTVLIAMIMMLALFVRARPA